MRTVRMIAKHGRPFARYASRSDWNRWYSALSLAWLLMIASVVVHDSGLVQLAIGLLNIAAIGAVAASEIAGYRASLRDRHQVYTRGDITGRWW